MFLEMGDWKFDIDMTRTMEYSAEEAADHCDCAYCRNFYAAVDKMHPQFRPFLAQFGVDIEAPEAMVPILFEDGTLLYDPVYCVFGRIMQYGREGMSEGKWYALAEEADEPEYFLLCCYDVMLKWHLSEPLEEVVSPANDPDLQVEAIGRLLGTAQNSDILS